MGRQRKIKIEPIKSEIENETVKLETETNKEPEANKTDNTNVDGLEGSNTEIEKSYETDLREIDKIIQSEKSDKEEKRGRKSKEEKARAAFIIPGSLFVRVHNYVGAGAIGLLDSYISKDNPVPRELVSMDEKMIQELAPLAELAMKQMKIEENPIAAFYVSFAAIMASNYMSVKTLIKQATKENPNFDITQLIKK